MTKIEDRYWIETDSFVYSPHSKKPNIISGIKGTSNAYVHAPHTQKPHNPSLHVLKYSQMLKFFVVNLNFYNLHNTLIFFL